MTNSSHKYIIYFEGTVDETTLVFFIKKLSENKILPNKLKSSLKFILIELITNMISHNNEDSYGSISIQKENHDYMIITTNFSTEQNFETVKSNINAIKKIKNVKEHYNDQLKNVSFDKSVNLGLIEIYNRCEGDIKVSSKKAGKQLQITFKIQLHDSN